jgi:DNA processing protein
MTAHLIKGLAGLPISIVSGLARGIDGIAHEAALEAGLHTIAIPGSGIDPRVIYPRRHLALAGRIIAAGGALLSEERPLTTPKPYLFPKRNRVMAGIADAILVIEAKEKSGTLITARLAVDYNRDVLVLTHDAENSGGIGCHRLIRDGAVPIREISDLIEALSLDRV